MGTTNCGAVMPIIQSRHWQPYLKTLEFIRGRGTGRPVGRSGAVSNVDCRRRGKITARTNDVKVSLPNAQTALENFKLVEMRLQKRAQFNQVILNGIQSLMLLPVMQRDATRLLLLSNAIVQLPNTTAPKLANAVIGKSTEKTAEIWNTFVL